MYECLKVARGPEKFGQAWYVWWYKKTSWFSRL